MSNYKKVQTEGKFSLWIGKPLYKEYKIGKGFVIRNTKTGDIIREDLRLYYTLFDENFNRITPTHDEDCYEIVEETNELYI